MNGERLYDTILEPVVSEKSTRAADASNQFVFRVARDSTKHDIAVAIEKLFKVHVESVQVLNVPAKRKRFGGRNGVRTGWRKAYVRLKDGDDIVLGADL